MDVQRKTFGGVSEVSDSSYLHNTTLSINPVYNTRVTEIQNYLSCKLLAPQLYSRLEVTALY